MAHDRVRDRLGFGCHAEGPPEKRLGFLTFVTHKQRGWGTHNPLVEGSSPSGPTISHRNHGVMTSRPRDEQSPGVSHRGVSVRGKFRGPSNARRTPEPGVRCQPNIANSTSLKLFLGAFQMLEKSGLSDLPSFIRLLKARTADLTV